MKMREMKTDADAGVTRCSSQANEDLVLVALENGRADIARLLLKAAADERASSAAMVCMFGCFNYSDDYCMT